MHTYIFGYIYIHTIFIYSHCRTYGPLSLLASLPKLPGCAREDHLLRRGFAETAMQGLPGSTSGRHRHRHRHDHNHDYHHHHHHFLLYQNVHHHYKGISSGHSPRIATGLSALEYPEPLKAFVDFLSNVL